MNILKHFHNPSKGKDPENLLFEYELVNEEGRKIKQQTRKLKYLLDDNSIVTKDELADIINYLKVNNLTFRDVNTA